MASGKCSRRRHLWRTSCAFVALLLGAASAVAQPGEPVAARGAGALDAFLADVRTLTAEFRQELFSADHELIQTDTGTLSLARPNRFRWVYAKPAELTIVADGSEIWIYDAELEQATVTPFDESVGSSPAVLLSGDRSVRDSFDIEEMFSSDGLDWVKLVPKTSGSGFASMTIGFSGREPRRLELIDDLKRLTRIWLDGLEVNPELAPSVFEFEVPPGVEVIGGEG